MERDYTLTLKFESGVDFMAWWLIIAGIILMSAAIFLKYLLYTHSDTTADSAANELQRKQQNKLKDINNELTGIINNIIQKEKQLRENIDQMNVGQHRQLIKKDKKKIQKEIQVNREGNVFKKDKKIFKQVFARNSNLPRAYKQVFNLSQQGQSPIKIAEQLDLGVRETELILKFHRRKADSDYGQ